jgi:hypothetical protein
MRLQFKQSVCFHGKDYHKGIHEVPEAVMKEKFFHKMLLAGLIAEPHVSPEVSAQKMKELADKLLASKAEAYAPPVDQEVLPEAAPEAAQAEQSQDDEVSEPKEESGKKKKHKR